MIKHLVFFSVLVVPAFVFAQGTGTIQSLLVVFASILTFLVSICSTFAFVVFFYGIALYILNINNNDKKAEEGKQWMFWSVIALFVLVTIWGLIGLLQKTVGNTGGPGKIDIVIPTF